MTPTDELAFVGEPPLFDLPDLPVYVSVTFSWDIGRARHLWECWKLAGYHVEIPGGPAFGDQNVRYQRFIPGRFVKEGVTFTSRGCNKNCRWCLVRKREGKLREINIAAGWILQDNNILACSRGHIERVFEMLRQQKRGIKFSGGLDIDYLQPWHVDLFKSIKVDELWVACDCERDLSRLDKATDLLADFSIDKKRCYVLVGFGGETQDQAQRRCEAVLAKGFLPFAQLYRGPESRASRGAWCDFAYFWSHPNLYRKTIFVDA